jgi:hypothetical protein
MSDYEKFVVIVACITTPAFFAFLWHHFRTKNRRKRDADAQPR